MLVIRKKNVSSLSLSPLRFFLFSFHSTQSRFWWTFLDYCAEDFVVFYPSCLHLFHVVSRQFYIFPLISLNQTIRSFSNHFIPIREISARAHTRTSTDIRTNCFFFSRCLFYLRCISKVEMIHEYNGVRLELSQSMCRRVSRRRCDENDENPISILRLILLESRVNSSGRTIYMDVSLSLSLYI